LFGCFEVEEVLLIRVRVMTYEPVGFRRKTGT